MQALLKTFMVAGAFVTLGPTAFSHGEFTPDDLLGVPTVALSEFEKTSPNQKLNVVGFKVWKSGEAAKAKLYYKHDGLHDQEASYVCNKHGEDENTIVCEGAQ